MADMRYLTSTAPIALADVDNLVPVVLNSSLMTPPDNGVEASASTSGQVQLTGSKTALVGTAGTSAALWGSAQAAMFVLDLDRPLVDGRNIRCSAMGTLGGTLATASLARAVGLQYASMSQGVSAERGNWVFYIRGESLASGAWTIPLTTMPATARGPFIALARNDGTNGYLSIYDVDTATWYDSAAVAKPSGWAGVSTLTNELVLGGDGSYVFPQDNSSARQNSNQWIGSFRDLVFANVDMSKADALAIFNGADPATQLGGASNVRLHVPCAVDGAFSSTATGTAAGGVTVAQQGALLPGPSLRRHSAANYVTLDRLPTVLGTNPGSTEATVQLSGTHGGTATGVMQVRQVGLSGTVYTGWKSATNTGSAGAWAVETSLVEASEPCDIQVRFKSAPELVASTGARHWVMPVVVFHGQSEAVLSIFNALSARALGSATSLNVPLVSGANKVSFSTTNWLGVYCRLQTELLAGYLGDEATAIANIVSADRPVHIVVNAINGTSLLDLMNDAATGRQWSDTLARCAEIGNRDAAGAIPVHAHIMAGWEAFYSGVDGVVKGSYKPFLTGQASNDIALADIDHWLFDGTFSAGAKVIVQPCNRASSVTAAGASTTDGSAEADQRDRMRNWSHILDYEVAVERVTHKLEGENAAGGALVVGTHPEDNDFEGDVEMAVANAEDVRLAFGDSTYAGPVFFETIAAGSSADKVKVTLGLPRPDPGSGLAEDAAGYSTSAQTGTAAYALHTKLTGGNAGAGFEARIRPSGGSFGAWSKANITSGSITDATIGEVELTLISSLSAGDTVEIRYHSGVPGAYATATLTQAAYRSGSLFFTGTALASAPASLADVQSLGFAVAGSNQALSFTA